MRKDGNPDYAAIGAGITEQTRMAIIQRSRGYSWRPSFTIAQIAQAVQEIKQSNPHCIVFVDNCYGEFVEFYEPLEAGGRLDSGVFNQKSRRYVSGERRLYRGQRTPSGGMCAEILTAPSLGGKIGPTFGLTRQLLHGLFLAPHVVGEALYGGAILAAQIFSELGFAVSPLPDAPRTDIVQAIQFDSEARLLSFVRGGYNRLRR